MLKLPPRCLYLTCKASLLGVACLHKQAHTLLCALAVCLQLQAGSLYSYRATFAYVRHCGNLKYLLL